jgi:hypothetical protein
VTPMISRRLAKWLYFHPPIVRDLRPSRILIRIVRPS